MTEQKEIEFRVQVLEEEIDRIKSDNLRLWRMIEELRHSIPELKELGRIYEAVRLAQKKM